jgi:uncharacterized protein YbgA (DUF1722 family)
VPRARPLCAAAVLRLALRRLRSARHDGGNGLRAFHARYKYLLMASDPAAAARLGRIAADAPRDAAAAAFAEYGAALARALDTAPAPGGHENAVLHMFGYVSESLSGSERDRFLAELAAFRAGTGTLEAPVARLWQWLVAQDVAYLERQSYFETVLRLR